MKGKGESLFLTAHNPKVVSSNLPPRNHGRLRGKSSKRLYYLELQLPSVAVRNAAWNRARQGLHEVAGTGPECGIRWEGLRGERVRDVR